MATETVENQILEVGVDLKSAIADMAKWQRATVALLEKVTKSSEQLGETVKKVNKATFASNKDIEDSIDELSDAYHKETVEVLKLGNAIDQLESQASNADDTRRKALEDQIALLREEREERAKSLKAKGQNYKMYKKEADEAKEAFKDAFKSFFSRDFKGAIAGLPKALAKSFKVIPGAGHRLKEVGGNMAGAGADRGGAGGAVMKLAGNAMKGMGSLMGSLKPAIEMISKLGPALSMVGGAVMGIVKLFLDLDAKAKEFNKEILKSASTTEFLAQSGGDTDTAYAKLESTLRGVRDAAYSLDNIQWGIMPDDYKAMIGTLNQEGVSLRTIGLEAERSGKSVQEFTSELAHVSVAYSRAFGVPIQQINELQAEMMTEMGIGLDQTKLSFQQMTRAAEDSGIAGNKFFAMIRGVSQDLSLWGTRMEDAVKLLGRLGQVMNPRNAQKFMQSAVQGLKNMGRTERLRLTLLTGQGKMGKLIERDTKRKAASLAKSLGMTTEDLIDKMQKKGPAGLEDAIQGLPKEMQGATREALLDMQLQQKRSGKGTFGMAGAARNMGPLGALEALKGAITRFVPGAKKLADAAGSIGGEMMAENLGISEEQLDQMIKLESSIDNQRDVLKNQLESGDAHQQDAAREALRKAGITAKTDKDLREKIDGAGYDEIMDTMSEGDKMLAEGATKQEVFAKQQADLQTSMLEKLQMMLDFLMNQIYDAMIDIWEAITSLTGFGGDKKDRDLKLAMYRNKDPNISKAYHQAGGDAYKMRGQIVGGAGGLGETFQKVLDKFANAQGDDAKSSASFDVANFVRRIDADFSHNLDGASKALKDAGIKTEDAEKVIDAMKDSGKSFSESMADAGFTNEQRTDALKKALWFMDPTSIAQMSHLASGAPTSGAAAPSSQATSAAKSASAGAPGGGAAAVASAPAAAAAQSSAVARNSDDSLSLNKEQLSTMNSIDNQLDKIKMDTGFISGPYSKAVESSVLAAVRTALFEYYMYKDIDQGQMAQMMASTGMSGRAVSQAIGEAAQSGMDAEGSVNALALKGHASGGMVTGVSNGLAQVTAAAGEGLASIGKGERIIPRGGGTGSTVVNLHVDGLGGEDLARYLKGRVNDAIYEYKRRERFM